MSRLRFHPAALQELIEAVAWYEEQREGLGVAFEAAVYARAERAVAAPGAGRLEAGAGHRELRWYRVARFPYGLLIGRAGEDLVVLAIAHERRRPRYWEERLDEPTE